MMTCDLQIHCFYPCKCVILFNQGNVPTSYIMSVLDIYDAVLRETSNNSDHVAGKVKQEILHGLGTKFISRFNSFVLYRRKLSYGCFVSVVSH